MANKNLRIVRDDGASEPVHAKPTVSVKLHQVFPLLMYAHRHNFNWLKDMADDDIVVTPDLAEILHQFEAILVEKRGA